MTTISMLSEIDAPAHAVWEVLMDSAYIPKLYPDVVSVQVDPPGRNVVGQKFHIVGKAGRRKLEILVETVEVLPEKRTTTKQLPGGLFKEFVSTVQLDEEGKRTKVKATFDYVLAMGYLGKIFNVVMIERLVMDNLKAYSRNLKEICELLPVS